MERSKAKIGWSGADHGVGIAENDEARAEHRAGGCSMGKEWRVG